MEIIEHTSQVITVIDNSVKVKYMRVNDVPSKKEAGSFVAAIRQDLTTMEVKERWALIIG